ncbi:MAG: amidohydrolase family protein [Sphingomonas sp.]|uniref:amidohydrolase family protein n=1 Tax=Sphingomonas sp. TaxID=28214 RepID=UPI0022727AC4|nr:amidohydrolase family protein [Sphingomonas sp.]MCX8474576.1 amidohydrolase family protein [Sphingomonas sp.]
MIDTHVHVWRIGEHGCVWPGVDLPEIYRDFDLVDFREAAGDAVEGVVLVQSQENAADTSWLLGLADPLIRGVVGWADLQAPDSERQVRALAGHDRLKGLRPMVQDREADWYDRADDAALAAMGEARLVLDALVRPRHLESLARLAARHPGLTVVIDHAAKPDFGDLAPWERAMRAIARHTNVHAKFSGLLTEPNAVVGHVFGTLWEAFGPERLIWGSDWPVLTLAAGYREWLAMAEDLVPPEHHDAVFGANARRAYRL